MSRNHDEPNMPSRRGLGLMLALPMIAAVVVASFAFIDGKVMFSEFMPSLMCLGGQLVLLFITVSPNPLGWWTPWFGTTVKVSGGVPDGTTVDQIRGWIVESVKWPYVEVNATEYKFLRKRDAMMFKLSWG